MGSQHAGVPRVVLAAACFTPFQVAVFKVDSRVALLLPRWNEVPPMTPGWTEVFPEAGNTPPRSLRGQEHAAAAAD